MITDSLNDCRGAAPVQDMTQSLETKVVCLATLAISGRQNWVHAPNARPERPATPQQQ